MINQQKKILRKEIRELKSAFDLKTLESESISVFEQIEMLAEFHTASTVLAYWSMADELKTHDFIIKWYKKKTILLPLVKGDNLELRVFSGMDCMVVGSSFGILEPQLGEDYNNKGIDLAIIPGLAFDKTGNRLGRGKGYYDRLLNDKKMTKIGVCFSFQLIESIPIDNFDICMDMVITSF
jgi:5-formyltetrahydrofolate cyclo-ligase